MRGRRRGSYRTACAPPADDVRQERGVAGCASPTLCEGIVPRAGVPLVREADPVVA